MADGAVGRLIFLKVSNVAVAEPTDVFAVNAERTTSWSIWTCTDSISKI
jgi:hypothetical protein